MKTWFSAGHDPLDHVEYIGDEFNYVKHLRSPAAQEALVRDIIALWRANGRDVQLIERLPEPTEYHG